MKKYLFLFLLLLGLPLVAVSYAAPPVAPQTPGSASISDIAYNESTWDGVTTTAPSKNAVRDKIETIGGTDDQTAAEVVFNPYGNIAGGEVQSAIEELDDEKEIADATIIKEADIDTPAELETVANLGAYASDILAATSEANFKSITNLEVGTDFTLLAATHDTAAELDALYEAELNNSAGLASALSDETGTGVVVFSTSPTLVTPVLGTPTSGTLTNCTGLPNAGLIVTTGDNYANFSGCDADADTLDELMACINTTFGGVTFSTLTGNLDQAEYYITEDEDSLTDSDAPSPNLGGGGTYFEFTDDGGTDVDNITGFTNFPTDTNVWFRFEDAYWTIDFSEATLYGHGGLSWSPRAGDSMVCRSHDGTKIECIVSMPTSLAISQLGTIPFDSTPDSDDSWSGLTAEFLAGETLSQWDLVYVTHDAGTVEIKKWDADGAAKALKPIGVVVESGGIADTESGTVGILWGVGRNDGWTFTDNQDEGKTVYGLATTAGAIGVTAPAVAGDIVCAVGVLLEEDAIQFNFGLCTSTEVPE